MTNRTFRKDVTDAELRAAMAPMIERLMDGVVAQVLSDPPAKKEERKSQPASRSADTPAEPVALSANDRDFLLAASAHDLPVTRLSGIAGLSIDASTKSRRTLRTQGLIETFTVILGPRVGGSVTLAELTPAGWKELGMEPPRTRPENVGAAHHWVQRRAVRYFEGRGLRAEIEGVLAGKRADVAIHTASGVQALEVEMSPANAIANVVRDLDAGFCRVLVVGKNASVKRAIEQQLKGALPSDRQTLVEVKALSDCAFVHAYLDALSGRVLDKA